MAGQNDCREYHIIRDSQAGLRQSLDHLGAMAQAYRSLAESVKTPKAAPNAQMLLNRVAYHIHGRRNDLNSYLSGEILLPLVSQGIMDYDPRSMEKDLKEAVETDALAFESLKGLPQFVRGLQGESVIAAILSKKKDLYEGVKLSNASRGFGRRYTVVSFYDVLSVSMGKQARYEYEIAADAIEQQARELERKRHAAKTDIDQLQERLETRRKGIVARRREEIGEDFKIYSAMLKERGAELDNSIEGRRYNTLAPYAERRAAATVRLRSVGLNGKSVEALTQLGSNGVVDADFLKKVRDGRVDLNRYKTEHNISLGPLYHSIQAMGDDKLAEVAAVANDMAGTMKAENESLRTMEDSEIVRAMKRERSSVDENTALIERFAKNVSEHYMEQLLENANPDENRPRVSTAELY